MRIRVVGSANPVLGRARSDMVAVARGAAPALKHAAISTALVIPRRARSDLRHGLSEPSSDRADNTYSPSHCGVCLFARLFSVGRSGI